MVTHRRQFAQHGPGATAAEQQVLERLKAGYPTLNLELTEEFCHYDIVGKSDDGKVDFIVEVKQRNFDWGRHPTVHVSETKLLRCCKEAAKLKAAFLFAVLCNTGLYVTQLNEKLLRNYPRKTGGRTDRPGIKHDVETLVDLPCNIFQKIP